MNKKLSLVLFVFLTVVVFLLGFGILSYGKEKPFQLLGYAVIPDISATMDKIEKVAGQIDPVSFKPNSLKGQVGMMLGDPAFKNFDNSKPAVAMVFSRPPVSKDGKKRKSDFGFAAFIPVKDTAPGQNTLTQMKIAVKIHEKMLVVGDHDKTINSAMENISLYKSIEAKKLKCDARLLVKIDSIMENFKDEINELIKSLQSSSKAKEPAKANEAINPGEQTPEDREAKENTEAIGKIVMYWLLDMAQQSVDYRLDITLTSKTILFESEHTTKTGSALNNFFQSSAAGSNKSLSHLPVEGQLAYAGSIDFARLKDYIDSVINGSVKREPSLKKSINQDIINVYKKYIDSFRGEIAFRYGLSEDGKLFACYSVATGKSEEENLAAYEEFLKVYNTAMKKNIKGISFSDYSLQRNVRKYKNISIHRYVMKGDYSQIKGQSKEVVDKLLGGELSIELAVVNGFMVGATDKKTLDKIIDKALTKGDEIELLAMKAFGKGMDSYADFDLIGLVGKVFQLFAAPAEKDGGKTDPKMDEMQQLLKKLEKNDRNILIAGKYNKGASFGSYQIPLRMIIDGGKYFNSLKKQPAQNQPIEGEGDEIKSE